MAQLTISDYKNNLFSNHFLEERIQDRDEWQEINFEEKFDELKKIYNKNKSFLTEDLNEDQTQQRFIDPVLKELGHEWTPEARRKVGSRTDGKTLNPDYAFLGFEKQLDINEDDEKDYIDGSYAVGDAKAWNKKLDKSSQDHTNPAFQIYNYVDRLRADWGVLTNGKKWRLYSYEKCAADIYFEVDLENLLAGEKTEEKLEAFKYFYLFFRAESFEEGFLDEIYQESVNFAEGLEDDLENKVYNALEVAVEGFFETNDIEKTPENIDLVHHASLIFLYRILFILNAESRNLLPTEYEAYKQAFGLTQLKRMIIDEEVDDPLFQETTVAWDNRISRLFEGIDDGYDLNETEIPAYNGGLFDEENGPENEFLAENKLYGTYLKEILELLATSYDEEKEKRIILDYKDLNIRHLGSVYEGLLEHKFKAADERKVLKGEEWQDFSEVSKDWEEFDEEKRVEENELYLTNESGERKATGSYYTPEYIVEYIVENTVGPKVEGKISEAEENGDDILPKILELNVCDPAMGSGHFLTEATEFIAEHIVEHADLEEQNIDENEDELNWAKRQVVQNCIYGVDVNELAVELGKLSLWIETMAEGKPLNFLDHHLKHGNSLIGSDFDEIFSHPTEDQKRLDSDRYQFGDPQEIKESFQEQYLEIEEMPENTVEQIHEKEQAYKQFIQENVLYQQFNQLANIHTRQFFQSEANSSNYESFLINIGNPNNPFRDEKWYKNAQTDAENRNYFHWQLEFPKVFFGEQKGFDAVVGNPPYFNLGNVSSDSEKSYFSQKYDVYEGGGDVCYLFYELSIENLGTSGELGFITSRYFQEGDTGGNLRNYLSNYKVRQVIDLGSDVKVFRDADGTEITVHTLILQVQKNKPDGRAQIIKFKDWPEDKYDVRSVIKTVKENINEEIEINDSFRSFSILNSDISGNKWNFEPLKYSEIVDKIERKGEDRLGDKNISEVVKAPESGMDRKETENGKIGVYRLKGSEIEDKNLEKDLIYPLIKTAQVDRFSLKPSEEYMLYVTPETNLEQYPNVKEHLEKFKQNLNARHDIKKNDNMPWYSWSNLRNQELYESDKDKILWPMVSPSNKFGFLPQKDRAKWSADVYYLVPSEDTSSENLLGLLNSSLMEFYHKRTAKQRNWGYSFGSSYVEKYPIKNGGSQIKNKSHKIYQKRSKFYEETKKFKEWVRSNWGVKLDDLSLKTKLREYWEYDFDEFMRVAKKNKSSIDGDVKSRDFRERMKEEWENSMDTLRPLMQEINELENEIDAIVFDLYDLTEEEVETVLDSLDAGEDEKRKILENFGEFERN